MPGHFALLRAASDCGDSRLPMHRQQAYTLLDDSQMTLDVRSRHESDVGMLQHRYELQRAAIRRIRDELEKAASLQRDLHLAPPAGNGVDFHVLYRPAEMVSGDTYEVVRLDRTHVAIALADAAGHGLTAGLLSVFVKRSLCGREVSGEGYRLLEPDEVLSRANGDILCAGFTECQFVTALYAVYHEPTRVVRWARAGAPYPILARRGEQPRQLPSDGPLLGVLPRPKFQVGEFRLIPGDTLVFHTDGLDTLLLEGRDDLGCCDLDRTEWFNALGSTPIETHLAKLEYELDAADPHARNHDDLTLVTLSVHHKEAARRIAADHPRDAALAPLSL